MTTTYRTDLQAVILASRGGRRVVDDPRGLGIMGLFVQSLPDCGRFERLHRDLGLDRPARFARFCRLAARLVHGRG